jgi:hypothetical protein
LPLSLYPIPLSLFPSGASNPLIPLPPFFDPSEIGVPPGVLGCSFPRGVLSGGVTAVRPLLCFHPTRFRFLAAVPYIRCPATTSAGVGPASFPPSPLLRQGLTGIPCFFLLLRPCPPPLLLFYTSVIFSTRSQISKPLRAPKPPHTNPPPFFSAPQMLRSKYVRLLAVMLTPCSSISR